MKLALATTVLFTSIASATFAADAQQFNITIRDHKFEPAVVEIPADTKVQLIVKNEDTTPEEFESHDMKLEKIIKGGGTGKFNVGPLKPGEYKFFGEFNEKTAQGKVVAR